MKVLRIITQLVPVIREVLRATSRQSPGGKRVTAEELDRIIEVAITRIRRILRQELQRS